MHFCLEEYIDHTFHGTHNLYQFSSTHFVIFCRNLLKIWFLAKPNGGEIRLFKCSLVLTDQKWLQYNQEKMHTIIKKKRKKPSYVSGKFDFLINKTCYVAYKLKSYNLKLSSRMFPLCIIGHPIIRSFSLLYSILRLHLTLRIRPYKEFSKNYNGL